MTRKDYVLLAEALLQSKPENRLVERCAQHRYDCEAITDALARENTRFDRARFLRACGFNNQE
jgi:hypothetical protein